MPWLQIYDLLNSPFLSTVVAALPIVVLLGLLGWGHVSAHLAAAAGLLTAMVAAIFIFHMPATTAIAAAVDGAAYGLFPIGWIVVMAIFLYTLTVESGQFEIVKQSVVSLSPDRRIQALLIAFSFGAFVAGAAGFGTPVAISSALLIGAGFRPLQAAGMALIANTAHSTGEVIFAWTPWALLSICVFVWGLQDVKSFFDDHTMVKFEVPGLHLQVQRNVEVAVDAKPDVAEYKINWLSATGTSIFCASVLSAIWMSIPPVQFCKTLLHTFVQMRYPLLTIALMLAIAYVTRYSGMDATLGLAFTRTGVLYPFFAAMLGWLGVALTGSDTSANALFGSLQRITAERLGLNPILICTANSTGGVMGKMIDAQSIVVAAVATQQTGNEGKILRFVFWHSVVLACMMGLLTLAQAYWLTWMVPGN